MGETMTFPEDINDFLDFYSFIDTEQIYTNGSELISTYRVRQALDYYYPKEEEKDNNDVNDFVNFVATCDKQLFS